MTVLTNLNPDVYLDLDDVTADLASDWCSLYNFEKQRETYRKRMAEAEQGKSYAELTPFPALVTVEDFFSDWNIDKNYPGAYDLLDHEDLFLNLKPFPGAVEGVRSLRKRFGKEKVFFLSSGTSRYAASEKMQWVERYFGSDMKLQTIIAHRKDVVGRSYDILVDDRPKNLQTWKGHGILVERPHNKAFVWDRRAKNWDDILRHVDEIASAL